jgi:transcriptional regulator with XRE-family HTH domain
VDHTRFETIAAELVRALRGRRSQTAFSARLGYKSNIVHRWESGQCWPSATSFLRGCTRARVDVARSFSTFYGRPPAWLPPASAHWNGAVAAFLRDLRGKAPITGLAKSTGYSRYSLSRWLKGSAQPSLPEYLHLIEATSDRLLDYIATLTSPEKVPSIAAGWLRLQRARELAYTSPWSHAVLRGLELAPPEARGRDAGWLGAALGIEEQEVARALEALHASGQIERRRRRWVPSNVTHVNTGRDPDRARNLKSHWSRTALERLEQGGPGLFGYTLFAVSREDLRRLRDLQLDYVRALQAIVASSKPNECVGLFCVQLIDLRRGDDNALATHAPAAPK